MPFENLLCPKFGTGGSTCESHCQTKEYKTLLNRALDSIITINITQIEIYDKYFFEVNDNFLPSIWIGNVNKIILIQTSKN